MGLFCLFLRLSDFYQYMCRCCNRPGLSVVLKSHWHLPKDSRQKNTRPMSAYVILVSWKVEYYGHQLHCHLIVSDINLKTIFFFFKWSRKKRGEIQKIIPSTLFLSLTADFWKGPQRWFSTRHILEGIWRFALWEWKSLCRVLTLSALGGYEKNISPSLCPLGVSIPCYYRISQC